MSNIEENNTDTDYNSQLLEYEKLLNEYAENGKYEQAELCKKKISNIQKLIKKKRKKDLEQRQSIENENLETSYKTEKEEFNKIWNEKFKELEERTQKAGEEINERHTKEMNDLYNLLEEKMNQDNKYHPSAEYIKLDNEEKQLVKFQRFNDASNIRKKKEKIKLKDIEKKEKEKQNKIQIETSKKSKRQELEKEILKKKFEKEFNELNLKKEKELERIEKKFYNKRLDLSQQQKTEKNFSENNRISSRRNIKETYSAFPNNFATTTESSKFNIYNNTNGNTNDKENHEENNFDNLKKNLNNNIEEDNKLNGIESLLNKDENEKNE